MPPRIDAVEHAPALIIGAGVAGLSAALTLGECTLLTKTAFGEGGSTAHAQGGIAAAIDPADNPRDHARDTVSAGGGIVDPSVAEELTGDGPEAIEWLLSLGARFDRSEAGVLALGREGGHGRRRVVHAHGDATGAEVMRTLTQAVKNHPRAKLVQRTRAIDLARSDGRIVGVLALDGEGRRVLYLSPSIILATGGACRIYSRTTNPPEATGDGIAIAARAGAELADMEFVQFHPTALDAGLDPLPLLTEALRGEGAILVNKDGGRFMVGKHELEELAPRDIVARSIWAEMQAGRGAFLDVREIMNGPMATHFALCRAAAFAAGLDPAVDLLPVSPAAHYFIGGVAVDHRGRSSLPGLWAVGEASSTGVHGANRLASNSLLEGIVFGRVVGRDVAFSRFDAVQGEVELPENWESSLGPSHPEVTLQIRKLMWDRVGVLRDANGLRSAIEELELLSEIAGSTLGARSLHICATLVAQAALGREESRGCHFRSDFPVMDPTQAARKKISPAATPTESFSLKQGASSR
jgi:L-aspartate oxidase